MHYVHTWFSLFVICLLCNNIQSAEHSTDTTSAESTSAAASAGTSTPANNNNDIQKCLMFIHSQCTKNKSPKEGTEELQRAVASLGTLATRSFPKELQYDTFPQPSGKLLWSKNLGNPAPLLLPNGTVIATTEKEHLPYYLYPEESAASSLRERFKNKSCTVVAADRGFICYTGNECALFDATSEEPQEICSITLSNSFLPRRVFTAAARGETKEGAHYLLAIARKEYNNDMLLRIPLHRKEKPTTWTFERSFDDLKTIQGLLLLCCNREIGIYPHTNNSAALKRIRTIDLGSGVTKWMVISPTYLSLTRRHEAYDKYSEVTTTSYTQEKRSLVTEGTNSNTSSQPINHILLASQLVNNKVLSLYNKAGWNQYSLHENPAPETSLHHELEQLTQQIESTQQKTPNTNTPSQPRRGRCQLSCIIV